MAPGIVYRLAGWRRGGPLGQMVVVEHRAGSARLRYAGPDTGGLHCARRQRWALGVVARCGGRRATLRESSCLARGASECEYTVAWSDGPRALPVAIAGSVPLIGLAGATLVTALPPAAWGLIPGAAAMAYVLERRRVARVEHVASAESATAFRWPLARTLAGRPEQRTQAQSAIGTSSSGDHVPVLEQAGEFWRVSYDGTTVMLRHSRGLVLLAHLVRSPGVNLHVRELDAITPAGGSAVARDAPAPEGDTRPAPGDAGEVLDERARADYRRHLGELRAELEHAERCHDLGRIDALRAEIALIADELRTATAASGRARRASADIERLRLAITRRIRSAIEQIAKHHPALGAHLVATVSTGYHWAYAGRGAGGLTHEPTAR